MTRHLQPDNSVLARADEGFQRSVSYVLGMCRGKLISRVENHVIWLEPFLKYNLGPFSWLYERMRPVTGKVYGAAGQLTTPTRSPY